MSKKRNIFISTSGTTYRFAEHLKRVLVASGKYNVFLYREDIIPGQRWREMIEKGLEGANHMIVLLSPAYMESSYCKEEWEAAEQELHRFPHILFPVMVEPTKLTRLKNTYQHLWLVDDLKEDMNYAVEKLIETFELFLKNPQPYNGEDGYNSLKTTLAAVRDTASKMFSSGEIGIVVADFVRINNAKYDIPSMWVSTIEDRLFALSKKHNLRFIPSQETVSNEREAQELLQKHNATVVIWGQIFSDIRDDLGNIPEKIRVNFLINHADKKMGKVANLLPTTLKLNTASSSNRIDLATNFVDLQSFGMYIRNAGDVEYLIYALLGLMTQDTVQRIEYLSKAINVPDVKNAQRAIDLNVDTLYGFQALAFLKLGMFQAAAGISSEALMGIGSQKPMSFFIGVASYLNLFLNSHILPQPPAFPINGTTLILDSVDTFKETALKIAYQFAQWFLNAYPNMAEAHFVMAATMVVRTAYEDIEGFASDLEVYKRVVEHLQKAVSLNPQDIPSLVFLGYMLRYIAFLTKSPQYYDRALIAFSNAQRLDSSATLADFGKALCFLEIEHKREAEKIFKGIIQKKKLLPNELCGTTFANDWIWGLFGLCLEFIEVPVRDTTSWAYFYMSSLYDKLHDPQKAVSMLKKVAGIPLPHALLSLANFAVDSNEWQKVIEYLDKALSIPHSTNAESLYLRGLAHYQLGNPQKAIDDWLASHQLGIQLPDGVIQFINQSPKG